MRFQPRAGHLRRERVTPKAGGTGQQWSEGSDSRPKTDNVTGDWS